MPRFWTGSFKEKYFSLVLFGIQQGKLYTWSLLLQTRFQHCIISHFQKFRQKDKDDYLDITWSTC